MDFGIVKSHYSFIVVSISHKVLTIYWTKPFDNWLHSYSPTD